jgi:hypothetical protein
MPRIGSPIGGVFDSRSGAMVGHRLVIEARDDMQVGESTLIVPAGSEEGPETEWHLGDAARNDVSVSDSSNCTSTICGTPETRWPLLKGQFSGN